MIGSVLIAAAEHSDPPFPIDYGNKKGLQQSPGGFPGVHIVVDWFRIEGWKSETEEDRSWDGEPSPQTVVRELVQRFNEAVQAYEAGKNTLPSCLRQAMDQFLKDLKEDKKQLYIQWLYNPQIGWHGLAAPDIRGSGEKKGPDWIQVNDAFRERYLCRNDPVKRTLTSVILLHEMFHAVKAAFPKCFKKLPCVLGRCPKEEMSAEDATIKIFGEADVCDVYRATFQFEPHEATFENICECLPECPI